MAHIELSALDALTIKAFRADDEDGEVVLRIGTGDGTVLVRCGRTGDDADQLADILRAAAGQAAAVAGDWKDRPDENDVYVTLDRGRWYLSWAGETRRAYPDRNVAVYEAAAWMAERGEFPPAWIGGEHGPACEPANERVRAFHDEGGSRLLPLPGVVFEPGDRVRFADDGDESMEVVRDYGELGVWLAVAGDHSAGEMFVQDRGQVQPAYKPGQLIEYRTRDLAGERWSSVPAVFVGYDSGGSRAIVRSLHNQHGTGGSLFALTEIRPVPAVLLRDARGWVADNQWEDVSAADDVADMSDAQVAVGIQAHYAGGWAAFRRDAG